MLRLSLPKAFYAKWKGREIRSPLPMLYMYIHRRAGGTRTEPNSKILIMPNKTKPMLLIKYFYLTKKRFSQ